MGKYLEGTITKREEALLESFDAGLLSKNHPIRFPRPPAPKRLRRSKGTRISRASWKGVALAAGIALLLGLGHSLLAPTGNPQGPVPPLQRTGNTQWGQKLNLTLADGTKVRLNSGSSLKYPEHFMGKRTEVPERAAVNFNTDQHTGELIPVFAAGKGAEHFQGIYQNNEIYHKMFEALDQRP